MGWVAGTVVSVSTTGAGWVTVVSRTAGGWTTRVSSTAGGWTTRVSTTGGGCHDSPFNDRRRLHDSAVQRPAAAAHIGSRPPAPLVELLPDHGRLLDDVLTLGHDHRGRGHEDGPGGHEDGPGGHHVSRPVDGAVDPTMGARAKVAPQPRI